MTRTILDEESIEGWRGEIQDGKVVRTHDDAIAEESDQDQEDYTEEPEEQDEPDEEEEQPA